MRGQIWDGGMNVGEVLEFGETQIAFSARRVPRKKIWYRGITAAETRRRF